MRVVQHCQPLLQAARRTIIGRPRLQLPSPVSLLPTVCPSALQRPSLCSPINVHMSTRIRLSTINTSFASRQSFGYAWIGSSTLPRLRVLCSKKGQRAFFHFSLVFPSSSRLSERKRDTDANELTPGLFRGFTGYSPHPIRSEARMSLTDFPAAGAVRPGSSAGQHMPAFEIEGQADQSPLAPHRRQAA